MFDTLVSAHQAIDGLAREGWRFVDCRFSLAEPARGRQAHAEGRIPGASYAHLDEDLSDLSAPGQGGRHPLPTPDAFDDLVRRMGISEAQVVVYDDAGGRIAARLWWMLRAAGHRAVAVLDGGWPAWIAAGGAVDRGPTSEPGGGSCRPNSWASQVVSLDEMMAIVRGAGPHPHPMLLDARSPERYAGIQEPIDPVAGHIPGALSMPCAANLGADGRMLGPESLATRFEAAGVAASGEVAEVAGVAGSDVDSQTIAYCGSGVTACHVILAAACAGLSWPRLYAGSWSEWCADPSRPVAVEGVED